MLGQFAVIGSPRALDLAELEAGGKQAEVYAKQ